VRAGSAGKSTAAEVGGLIDSAVELVAKALRATAQLTASGADLDAVTATFRSRLEAVLLLPKTKDERLCAGLSDAWTWVALFGRLVSEALLAVAEPDDSRAVPGNFATFDSLELAPVLAAVFRDLGLDDGAAWRLVGLIRMLRTLPLPSTVAGRAAKDRPSALVRALLAGDAARAYMGVNIWEDVTWFNRESFSHVLWWMLCLDALAAAALEPAPAAKRLAEARRLTEALQRAAELSGYQLDRLESAALEG
jgi:hypothetical protein